MFVAGELSDPLIPKRGGTQGREFVGGRLGRSHSWTGVGEGSPCRTVVPAQERKAEGAADRAGTLGAQALLIHDLAPR